MTGGKSDKPVALVTGASRGIGRAFALAVAKRGYHVIALARTTGGLEELDDEIIQATGARATLIVQDLSRPDELVPLGYGLMERFGRLDLFAGVAAASSNLTPTWQADPADFKRCQTVNVEANFRLIQTLHPLLIQADTGGKILIVGGGAPEPGRPYWTSYAASKAALEVMVRTYASEMAKQRLDVVVCNPGPTATKLRKVYYPGEDQSALQTPADAAERLCKAISI